MKLLKYLILTLFIYNIYNLIQSTFIIFPFIKKDKIINNKTDMIKNNNLTDIYNKKIKNKNKYFKYIKNLLESLMLNIIIKFV